MTPTLNITIPRPSEDQIAILRTIAMSPVTSVAVIDVKHPEGFALLQKYGLVESNEHAVWCSPLGRLVLAADDAEAAGDGGQVEKLKDATDAIVEFAKTLFDRVAPLVEGLSDEVSTMSYTSILNDNLLCIKQTCGDLEMAFNALDAATDKGGEGGS